MTLGNWNGLACKPARCREKCAASRAAIWFQIFVMPFDPKVLLRGDPFSWEMMKKNNPVNFYCRVFPFFGICYNPEHSNTPVRTAYSCFLATWLLKKVTKACLLKLFALFLQVWIVTKSRLIVKYLSKSWSFRYRNGLLCFAQQCYHASGAPIRDLDQQVYKRWLTQA